MRVVILLWLFSLSFLRAELLPEALGAFPANTVSLEYDNLTMLRQLPNYRDLRQQYSSESLKRVKQTLLMLGISEDQLSEVVTASGPGGFFGLVAGNFGLPTAAKKAAEQNLSRLALGEGSAFCSHEDVCVLFPSNGDGNAAFGSFEQLRALLAVRQGHAASVRNSALFLKLLAGMDMGAPVIGLTPGSEIGPLMKGVVPQELSSRFDFSQWFSSIESFGYSVRIDTSAHLAVNLLCKSEPAGKLLSDTLNAAGSLQHMMALAGGDSLSFRNLVASASGRVVALKLDARLGM